VRKVGASPGEASKRDREVAPLSPAGGELARDGHLSGAALTATDLEVDASARRVLDPVVEA
jgi:hypothetical protein